MGKNYWKLEKTWENYGNGKHLENCGKHDVERINWTYLVISTSSSRQKIESLTAGIEENQLKSICTVGRFQQRLQILGQMMPVANLDEPTMDPYRSSETAKGCHRNVPVGESDDVEMLWCCFAISESYISKDQVMRHSYKHSLGASLLPLLLWAPHDTSSDDARELFSTILHLVVVPSSLSAFTLHAHMYGCLWHIDIYIYIYITFSILVGALSKCWWIHIPGFCSARQPGNVNSSKAEFLCCSREISTGWGMSFLDSKICWLYTTRHELDPDIFHQILGSANEGNSVRHGFLR